MLRILSLLLLAWPLLLFQVSGRMPLSTRPSHCPLCLRPGRLSSAIAKTQELNSNAQTPILQWPGCVNSVSYSTLLLLSFPGCKTGSIRTVLISSWERQCRWARMRSGVRRTGVSLISTACNIMTLVKLSHFSSLCLFIFRMMLPILKNYAWHLGRECSINWSCYFIIF